MMNLNEFIQRAADNIKVYLPEEYAGAEVVIQETIKLNHSYPALIVRKDGQEITASIDLERCYRSMNGDYDFGNVMISMAEMVQSQPERLNVEMLKNYESVKGHLFIRVSDPEMNQKILSDVPHKMEAGLAITYHILLDVNDGEIGSTIINNGLMEQYGIKPEQLHKDAIENSPKIMPPTLMNMKAQMDILLGLSERPDVPLTFEQAVDRFDIVNDHMGVLSNEMTVNGAAVIFYPEVLPMIADKAQMNFFILPSSRHEVLVVPDDGSMNLKDLTAMVKEINETEVKPEDRLSDTVLHYDSKEHLLEKGTDYEKRMDNQREEKADASPKPKHRKDKSWER